ncbi:MAG: GFA family protein [Chloroflexota bacterium]
MPINRSGFKIIHGEPSEWIRASASGRQVACAFCSHCGTRLFHAPSRNPSIVNVKPGTLDNTRWLRPVGHLWIKSVQPWIVIPDATLRFDAQPADFAHYSKNGISFGNSF